MPTDPSRNAPSETCVDCESIVPEADVHDLVNGDGPLCRDCWLTYPTEGEDPSAFAPQTCPICDLERCDSEGATSCCWSCHRAERITRRTYRVCFECGHVWTRWALIRAFRREVGHWRRPSRIYSCVECIHDW